MWSLRSGASSGETEAGCRLANQQDGKVARLIGTVQATDADAAIRQAIEKLDIKPEHQDRIAAWQRSADVARLAHFFCATFPNNTVIAPCSVHLALAYGAWALCIQECGEMR